MARDITISPSQIQSMDCRLRWHWGYRKGYRSKGLTPALDLGTGIHAALEAHYGRNEDPVEVFDEWATVRTSELDPSWTDDLVAMQEVRELGTAMLNAYVEEYGTSAEEEGFEVLATERTLKIPLHNPLTGEESPYFLVARLDGIVRDLTTGKIFSLEHKTYSRLDTKIFDIDPQFSAQVALARECLGELGLENETVAGVIYNGLRKQKKTPRVRSPLFHRERIYRNDRQTDVFLHQAYHKATEFYSGEIAIYPEPSTMKCAFCDFNDPCKAYVIGDDWKYLMQIGYVGRGGRPIT